MKPIFNYTILLCFLFLFACTDPKEINPLLIEVENQLENNLDSASSILESIHIENIDTYNKAHYYLLLIKVKEKNKESLLSEDPHLDWILEHIDDKKLAAKAMIYKGKIWSELEELEEAVLWYQKAVEILEEERTDDENLSIGYIDLGKIFLNQSLYDEAMEIFQKAHLLNNKKPNKKFTALALRNIGWVHFHKNNQDSVYHYLKEALVFAKQDKDSLHLTGLIYNDLASYYEEIGDYEKALLQLQNITKIKDNTYLNMGSMLLNMQQYDSARHYLLLGAESNYIYTKVASYMYLEKLENTLGDNKKAYYYSQLHSDLKDSIDLKERVFGIKAIDLKYNIKKTITKLEKQHESRNKAILSTTLFFLIIIVTVFIVRDKKKKAKHRKQKHELSLKEKSLSRKEKELIILKSKLENTVKYKENDTKLDNIQKLIQKKETDLIVLLNQITTLQCEIFKRTKIFDHIMEINLEREEKGPDAVLKNKEQEILKKEVNSIFETFIDDLRKNCESLTNEDLLFCCLSLLKLPNPTIGICFGSSNTDIIKQRKCRIKSKMSKTDSSFLFNFMFPPSSKAKL